MTNFELWFKLLIYLNVRFCNQMTQLQSSSTRHIAEKKIHSFPLSTVRSGYSSYLAKNKKDKAQRNRWALEMILNLMLFDIEDLLCLK